MSPKIRVVGIPYDEASASAFAINADWAVPSSLGHGVVRSGSETPTHWVGNGASVFGIMVRSCCPSAMRSYSQPGNSLLKIPIGRALHTVSRKSSVGHVRSLALSCLNANKLYATFSGWHQLHSCPP
jgi:hypothetical protein